MHTRHDLTDEQWAKLEPLLPDRTPIRGGRWMDHRKVVNGVLWRTRSGSAWRDLPPEYGNWKAVYNRHRRWSGDGTWREVLSGLRVDRDVLDGGEWVLGVDGTVIRARHHAAGARHEPPKDIPSDVHRRWGTSDLTYSIEVLEGSVPTESGAVTLFIDPLGRPLSPVSLAGMNRRGRRRDRRR